MEGLHSIGRKNAISRPVSRIQKAGSLAVVLILLAIGALQLGCASFSRFHAAHIPPGALTLVQIRGIATAQEITNIPSVVETFRLAGIAESSIKDGMVADGRIFCCGGPNEDDYSLWFYVPEGKNASVGDIVEIEMGAAVHKGESMRAPPNTMQRARAEFVDVGNTCRWVPENPYLWGRVIYCDWMEKEGWVQQDGLFNVWMKSAN
jgi:hypothetical protein